MFTAEFAESAEKKGKEKEKEKGKERENFANSARTPRLCG